LQHILSETVPTHSHKPYTGTFVLQHLLMALHVELFSFIKYTYVISCNLVWKKLLKNMTSKSYLKLMAGAFVIDDTCNVFRNYVLIKLVLW